MSESFTGEKYIDFKFESSTKERSALDAEPDRELISIADKLCQHIDSVRDTLESGILSRPVNGMERVQFVLSTVRNIQAPNDGRHKPSFFIESQRHGRILWKFEPMGSGASLERTSGYEPSIVLGCKALIQAQTPEAFQKAIEELYVSVHHEAEHLEFSGRDLSDPSDVQETIEYLAHPGEIRAHARQFAFRYVKEFPQEPFTVENMKKICNTKKEYNYFVVFANPDKQKIYQSYADLKQVYENVVSLTSSFVDAYRQNIES